MPTMLFDQASSVSHEQLLKLAPGCNRVAMEIGPGDGGFLVDSAREFPSTFWLGMEVRPSSVASVLARPDLPSNMLLLHADGRWIVENLLGARCVDEFHIYFPDPWWKKRHGKRRLFRPAFCRAMARALVPGGAVYVITDVEPRFQEICEELETAGFSREEWQRPPNARGMSSYERKYRRQGRGFHSARFSPGP